MEIRRILLALFVALLLSAGATYFLYSRLRGQRSAAPATSRIVVAARALEAGSPLTGDTITLAEWPASVAIAGAITKPEEVIGRSLIYPVSANQPVLETDIAAPGSGIGLSVKIPEGMRAIAVRSNDVVGVAGFLYPGSHVDVVLTYRPETAAAPVTATILQDVTVLTAGQTIEPDPKGKPEPVNVVTLLLSPDDSQKMVMATQQGTVQFVMRNGADQNKVSTRPVLMSEMLGGPKQEKVSAPTHPAKTAKLPDFYTVETIAGDKHSIDKF